MKAPPNIDSVTTHSDSDVVHWLANDTRDERFIDNIFAELCVRLQRTGIPVKRASLHLLIYHPQWLGTRIMWADGMREAEMARVDYDVRGDLNTSAVPQAKFMTVLPRCTKISNGMRRWAVSTPSMTRCGPKV